jgi:hypothetical protein
MQPVAMRLSLLLVLLVPLTVAAQGDGPGALHVGVQTPDGEPLPGAAVVLGDGRGAATNAEGVATLDGVGPGSHTVRVSFVGFTTQEVEVDLDGPGPWALLVELPEDAALLGDVVVEADGLDTSRLARDGFFRRQRRGGGTVLNAEDLARRNSPTVSGALGGAPGVRVQQGATGATARSTRGGCRMSVYLDGTYNGPLTDDLDAIPPQDIVAVEIYRDSQVPVQYRPGGWPGSTCGVVLLWTRFSTVERR